MMQNHPKGIILGLALLIFSAVFGGENAELPNVKLTGAAVSEAKNMLSEESDKKAVLAMIKGNYAIFGKYGHIKEKRSGWMLRVVNREQFTNEPKKIYRQLRSSASTETSTW